MKRSLWALPQQIIKRVATPAEIIDVGGIEVRVSNPAKVFFPGPDITKMDLVQYYLEVAEGALRGCYLRPSTMYRWPNGVLDEEPFYQKRVPPKRPEWIETVVVRFPSGRSAEMICPTDAAHIA